MGELNKQTLKNWVEYECQRQLFLTLAKSDPLWMQPVRKIVPLRRTRKSNKAASKFGKNYEQEVYSFLQMTQQNVEVKTNPQHKVVPHTLHAQNLSQLAQQSRSKSEPTILLEHEFNVPDTLLHSLLKLPSEQVTVQQAASILRPDILILTPLSVLHATMSSTDHLWHECLPDMTTRMLDEQDQQRMAIHVVDIKATPIENIGKKHWIELFFYAHALTTFIYDHQLQDQLVVVTQGHGIFPHIELRQMYHLRTWQAIQTQLMLLPWKDSIRLYERTRDMLAHLSKNRPHNTNDTAVHIQPACGRCIFLDDCKESMGMDQTDPQKYDVRLLPYTNTSTAELLHKNQIHTIQDLIQKLPLLPMTSTPDPLYPETPLLMLKAQAFAATQTQAAQQGQTTSMALPKWSENAITFNLEHDPIHDRVFNISCYWNYSISKNQLFYKSSCHLWQCIESILIQNQSISQAYKVLQESTDEIALEDVQKIVDMLKQFTQDSGVDLSFDFDSEYGHHVYLEANYINDHLEHEYEAVLLRKLLVWMVALIDIAMVVERVLSMTLTYPNYSKTIAPTTALFHWSRDPITAIEDLLQRHLHEILVDDQYTHYFEQLSRWLSPSEIGIRNAQYNLKFYDLKTFVESTTGMPFVLNYTWHEIYQKLFNIQVSQKYWTNHFNYIDFAAWHEILDEADSNARYQQIQELKNNCALKVMAINRLRIHFQSKQSHLISQEHKHKTVSTENFQQQDATAQYHKLAHSWYLYAKLLEGTESIEVDHLRITYPEWSIGKLKAAEVSQLQINELEKHISCTFTLHNISSNMKLDTQSSYLLVPQEHRHDYVNSWSISIEQLEWLADQNCFRVKTKKMTKVKRGQQHLKPHVKALLQSSQFSAWYLYPKAFGTYWSRFLFDSKSPNRSLLTRSNLGVSWLGLRRSYLLHYESHDIIQYPSADQGATSPHQACFNQAEVMMYAPNWMNQESSTSINHTNSNSTTVTHLLSPLNPKPDPSQTQAILSCLNHQISAIQGPPGTGKSQTITALLDELFTRAEHEGRSLKVLISSFSYQALHVLLNKASKLLYADGSDSRVKKIQKVFMRSDSKPAADASMARDLKRSGSTWSIKVTKDYMLTDGLEESFIMFAVPNQAHYLSHSWMNNNKVPKEVRPFPEGFGFDVIIVDEASQMPVDYCLPLAHLLKPVQFQVDFNTDYVRDDQSITQVDGEDWAKITSDVQSQTMSRVIFVGDQYQLPPVQPITIPKQLEAILGSAFDYYVTHLNIPTAQLKTNYRSHQDLVDYTYSLGLYEGLNAHVSNATRTLHFDASLLQSYPQWIQNIMRSDRVVQSLIHPQSFDTALSDLEAHLTQQLVLAFYQLSQLSSAEEEMHFWRESIGIVAPHNAHGNLIIRQIYQTLVDKELTHLPHDQLMEYLRGTIFSVEKFQGSDRDLMIATMGISAMSQLQAEEAFIYDLNRFNVLTSRSKSKMILICSRNYLDYFPKKQEVFAHAAKIRSFANSFCNHSQWHTISFKQQAYDIEYRHYQHS